MCMWKCQATRPLPTSMHVLPTLEGSDVCVCVNLLKTSELLKPLVESGRQVSGFGIRTRCFVRSVASQQHSCHFSGPDVGVQHRGHGSRQQTVRSINALSMHGSCLLLCLLVPWAYPAGYPFLTMSTLSTGCFQRDSGLGS